MPRKILIIDGHPDPASGRFCHALARAYADGATAGGHEARTLTLAHLNFPLLRSAQEWENGDPPPAIKSAQEAISWADHLVFVYPLWLGAMPALLKGFLEQTCRPGFAIKFGARTLRPGLLTGKSARIVITMGMPGFVYRLYFRAHSLRSFKRNILRFIGIGTIRDTLIGDVAAANPDAREQWLGHLRGLGREAR